MNGPNVPLPPEFWRGMSAEEFAGIVKRNYLNRAQCRRLWKILGRTDEPPDRLVPMVSREDVMRLFPPITRH